MIEFDIAFRPGDDFAVTFGGEVPLEAEMGQVMEVLATEERTVELSMPYGNQVILPTSGKVMRKVTIQKPDTLLSENIKKDVVIGGVTGTLEDGGSFKAVIERTAVSPTLPGDLTTIGYSAFSGCPNLALTSLPSGMTNIGSYAFQSCPKLALTSLPSGITRIGYYAFNGCRNLAITRLPPGITNIGFGVFANCTGLTSITFEGNPKTIHSSAFNGCSNLTTIYVPWSQGQVANAPWGASKATIIYDYTEN
ncbi:MAG: leucine-rich repeat domain-containing protein [Oscillospiraceae bacterium]|nr:leucine-rich repeat domain-containing protein [Oscillospiraceae bacterium]